MANVDSLRQSITEMPKADAINLLLDIRQDRRETREAKARRRSAPKSAKPKQSKNKLLSIIGGLSPEQAQKLLEELSE